MEQSKIESRGYWPNIVRIGRPDCVYDNRTKYSYNMEEFDKAMQERKNSGSEIAKEVKEAVELEE